MEKKFVTLFILFFLMISFGFAMNVSFFSSQGCPHCANVIESGVLEEIEEIEEINLVKYNASDAEGYVKYSEIHEKYNISAGVPLLVIEDEENFRYLLGDIPIIENAVKIINDFENSKENIEDNNQITGKLEKTFNESLGENGKLNFLGILILVVVALIDSINPCAFGVLIFLMISLLHMGNSKRALKIGLFYSGVIFVVYFLAGIGLFKFIQQFLQIRGIVYLIVGILVLLLGLLEFRDYIFSLKGKESILKISPKIKPFIEKYSKQGTVLAILILGVVVALFELPCTGGVYLGIISMLSQQVSSAYLYLIIYNLIFVVPLIVLTILVSRGLSPEKLQKWNSKNRTWMKLGMTIVMLLLATYLLFEALPVFL